jgi:hypothetical protein
MTIYKEPKQGFLPFGKRMIIPCILAGIAMIFTWTASFHCSFFQVTKSQSTIRVGFGLEHTHLMQIKVGLWSAQEKWQFVTQDTSAWIMDDDNTGKGAWISTSNTFTPNSDACVPWNASDLDLKGNGLPGPAVRFARMFSIFATILATFLVIGMISHNVYSPICGTTDEIVSTLPNRPNWPKISMMRVLFCTCMGLGMLTFLFLTVLASPVCSDDDVDECRLSGAGYMCVLAVMLWWLSAITTQIYGREPDDTVVETRPTQPAHKEEKEEESFETDSSDEEDAKESADKVRETSDDKV